MGAGKRRCLQEAGEGNGDLPHQLYEPAAAHCQSDRASFAAHEPAGTQKRKQLRSPNAKGRQDNMIRGRRAHGLTAATPTARQHSNLGSGFQPPRSVSVRGGLAAACHIADADPATRPTISIHQLPQQERAISFGADSALPACVFHASRLVPGCDGMAKHDWKNHTAQPHSPQQHIPGITLPAHSDTGQHMPHGISSSRSSQHLGVNSVSLLPSRSPSAAVWRTL